ncbi:MAG TPA: hypothetical protein VNB24_03000 [Acidimicrobiales bacterium]|nr:hypothetical protein [Acidimicrobiales bacterium]
MPELVEVTAGDPPELWSSLGFTVQSGRCRIGTVDIVLDPDVGKGIRRWSFAGGAATPAAIEGLPTEWVDGPGEATTLPHDNGVVGIDHIVVLSPDVDRTVEALAEVGFEPRRERLTDTYGSPMRQVFFRAGDAILELIGGQTATGEGKIRVFGLALTSGDLDATVAHFGERLHRPKDAVQPGRRIATLDRSAGSTVALAFMSSAPVTTKHGGDA